MVHALTADGAAEDKAGFIAREYEDFAYIVSHDLSAPLRHVKQFMRLLIESRRGRLSPEEEEYVSFIEKALEKLDQMQQALLDFSRLNTRAGPPREVNLNHAVPEVLKELDTSSAPVPKIEYGGLPVITAEPRQIHALFFHLIGNALKFHEDGAQKRIVRIRATDQRDSWLFEIRDNGIGMDEKYHEEAFRLFRRLEPDKYPGIGAGLTIARKIAERHGGEMLIESEPGKGVSVFFSLPKRPGSWP